MTVHPQSKQVSNPAACGMTKFLAVVRNHPQEGETRAREAVLCAVDSSLNYSARAAIARAFWRFVRVWPAVDYLMREG